MRSLPNVNRNLSEPVYQGLGFFGPCRWGTICMKTQLEAQGSNGTDVVPDIDRRAARRSSLMYRAAKLLCESGEYVGIVRDVSATGLRLRLFHAPPPERHLFIELANAERFAMERMWARGDEAGFRFSCTIDVAEFIREPSSFARRPIRLNIAAPARLTCDGQSWPVHLRDLSQHGARIDAELPVAVGKTVRLDIAGLPPRIGCVRWRRHGAHGLVFQQAYPLDAFAQYALTLQPFTAIAMAESGLDDDLARCA